MAAALPVRQVGTRLALSGLVLTTALTARGQDRVKPPPVVHRSDDEQLLFQLLLGPVILSDSFPGFPAKDGMLLPLGELCRELDLAVQVEPDRGLAEGFLVEEKRRFRLDVGAGTVTLGGKVQAFDTSFLEVHGDDLYLDTRLLAQFLPVDITVARRLSGIILKAREVLPLQARWKREGEAARLRTETHGVVYDPMPDPYHLAQLPAVDATFGLQGARASAGTKAITTQASVLASGDLLGLSTIAYANAQDPGGVSDFHMTAGRRDPHDGLLGPLHASAYEVGEILTPGLNLLAGASAGTGLRVTNQPLQNQNTFDRHSFQGDLPPGWQVELYQNQGLVAFQASRPDGRYEFLNIPLTFGLNSFRLVFYGPQGQRREETATFDVSQSQTPPGKFYYELASTEPRDLFGRRTELQASYGLTGQLAAQFSAAAITLDGVPHQYAEVGLQGFSKPLSGSFTYTQDSRGGSAAEVALRTRLGPISVVAKDAELLDGFQSEIFLLTDGQVRRRTTLELATPVPTASKPWFAMDFQGYRDQLVTGGASENLNFHLTSSLDGYYFSNQIARVGSAEGGAGALATNGLFLVSKVLGQSDLRAEADYTLTGGRRLQTLTLGTDLNAFPPYTIQAALSHAVTSRDTTLNLGVVRTQGAYGFGGSLLYSRLNGLSVNVSLRLGLVREPREHHIFTRAQGEANFGAVSAMAYLDTNGNGQRDPEEKPLPGVGFLVNGSGQTRVTDRNGVAFLEGLPLNVDANIGVNAGTLEDPLMRPERAGVRVTPRAGHVVMLDVPIVLFSEISGTAYLMKNGRKEELPGLRLELLDHAAKVIKSLRTAYDGFYSFGDLPPGTYTLVVDEAIAKRHKAAAPAPRTFHLAPEGTLLDGVDFVLEPAGAPETPQVPAGQAQ